MADAKDLRTKKNMDRWLGDGGMPIIAALGGAFDGYGVEGDGWATGTWVPTALACNPHGIVQAGVHSVLLDAAMNFAINAGLTAKDRTRATLEMKTEIMRVANAGDDLVLKGTVARQAKLVAYAESTIRSSDGTLVSRSTGTFLLHREPSP
ncbi:MAG TPA: PaaI family thioesterase [Acidimicrobiales bacterium]|nr:PaaI family thioesterase [Acidimicrobiales bacterium]